MMLPPYRNFPTFTSDHIRLRAIVPDDLEDIVEISYYDGQKAQTAEDALKMLDKINADYQRGDSINWGITTKEEDTIVGTCGYYRGFANGTGELGFVLKSAFRGKGYMSAAVKAAAEFGLQKMGLQRVIAITGNQNTKAIQVLERAQFVKTKELEDDYSEYEFRVDGRL